MQMKDQDVSLARNGRIRMQSDLPRWGAGWLLLGMWWLLVGLTASPVGAKVWNPGKPYHDSLIVLFMAPALWWVWKRRGDFGKQLIHNLEGCLLILFLAWASLSSVWANYGHVGDAIFAAVYILLFVVTWAALVAGNPGWFRQLLFWAAVGMALSALVAMISFPWRAPYAFDWRQEGRLVSFGMLDNPNLAAFAYGVGMVWLTQATVRKRWRHVMQAVALVVLAAAVVMTFSRAAWLAIVIAQVCMLVAIRHRHVKLRAVIILVVAVAGVAFGGMHYIEQRGLSYRPQILSQAWQWIEAHPWRGLGDGSRYTIQIDGQSWMHSHNVFTHTAIVEGLPAAALWIALWLSIGWRGLMFRHTAIGRCLLALWLFSTVAFQFDAPELMQKPSVEWLMGWLPLAISMGLAWRAQTTSAVVGRWRLRHEAS